MYRHTATILINNIALDCFGAREAGEQQCNCCSLAALAPLQKGKDVSKKVKYGSTFSADASRPYFFLYFILFYASITPVIANVKLRDSGNPSSETQGQLVGAKRSKPGKLKSEGQKFSRSLPENDFVGFTSFRPH